MCCACGAQVLVSVEDWEIGTVEMRDVSELAEVCAIEYNGRNLALVLCYHFCHCLMYNFDCFSFLRVQCHNLNVLQISHHYFEVFVGK